MAGQDVTRRIISDRAWCVCVRGACVCVCVCAREHTLYYISGLLSNYCIVAM